MLLTELVLQGVRCFASPRKLGFKPGLNVVWGGKFSGKTTLLEVLSQLLYAQPLDQVRGSFSAKPPMPVCRAGASFQQGDQIYRKVEDYTQAAVVLSHLNPKNNGFETVSQDRLQIEEFLKKNTKAPPEEVFRILHCSMAAEFPSNKSGSSSRVASGLDSQTEDPQILKRELQSLRKLHQDAQKIKQMQYELDGIHKESFELADVMKKSEMLRKKIEAAQKEMAEVGRLPEIPDDLEVRAEAYDRAHKKNENDLPQLVQEHAELQQQLEFLKPAPLAADGQLYVGAILCVAAIIGVSVTTGRVQMFGLPAKGVQFGCLALAIAGFLAAFFRLIQFFTSRDKYESVQKEVKKRTEKIRNAERKFEVETTVVRNILKALSADSTGEMFSTIQKIREAHKQVQDLEALLNVEKAKPQYAKAAERLPQVKSRAQEVEQELQLLSATPLDPETLEWQIRELEDKLRQTGAVVGPESESPSGDWQTRGISKEFIEKIGRDSFHHPTHRLIMVAAWALQVKPAEFLAKLLPPLDKNLAAFSFKNLSDPKVELDGTYSIQDAESKARSRFEQLEPFKQDLAYLALKFTLLQFLLREFPYPLILDSAFATFDERMQGVIAKSVKFLSQQSQVLLFTDQEVYSSSADHVQKL